MFNLLNIIQSVAPKDNRSQRAINIVKGRCVRQRNKLSECRQCFDACPSGALSWKEGSLHWQESLCQNCLLCTAICPVGAFQSGDISFVSIFKKLANIEHPVVGCYGQSQSKGHARVPCLGVFADVELLLAIDIFLGKSVQFDMTQCHKCRNGSVVEHLVNTTDRLAHDVRISLVSEDKQLNYVERQCNRREFFSLLRGGGQQPAEQSLEQIKPYSPPTDFRSKRPSLSRHLLLQAVNLHPDKRAHYENSFWPQIVIDSACQPCRICSTMCPTGALSKPKQQGSLPEIYAKKCVSCHLCETVCKHSAIRVSSSLK